jgi:membrane-associated phospholipid phosphatase
VPPPAEPPSRIAAFRWLRILVGDVRDGYRALPAGALRRWAVVITLGWFVSAGVTWLVVHLGYRWDQTWMHGWDLRAIRWVEQRSGLSFSNAIILESPGNLAYMIPLTLAVAAAAFHKRRFILGLSFIASYALARPLTWIGWSLWDRPRPQVIAEGIASPSLHSYPSGHVLLAASVYGLLAYCWWNASRSRAERVAVVVLTVGLVSMVGLARTRLGAHWPSDLIAGAVIAAVWIGAVVTATRWAEGHDAS